MHLRPLLLGVLVIHPALANPPGGEPAPARPVPQTTWAPRAANHFAVNVQWPVTLGRARKPATLFLDEVDVQFEHNSPSRHPLFVGDADWFSPVTDVVVLYFGLFNPGDDVLKGPGFAAYTERSLRTHRALTPPSMELMAGAHQSAGAVLRVPVPVGTPRLVLIGDTENDPFTVTINLERGEVRVTNGTGAVVAEASGRLVSPRVRPLRRFSPGLRLEDAQLGGFFDIVVDQVTVLPAVGDRETLRVRLVPLKYANGAQWSWRVPTPVLLRDHGRSVAANVPDERPILGLWYPIEFPLLLEQRFVRLAFGDPVTPSHLVQLDLETGQATLERVPSERLRLEAQQDATARFTERAEDPDTWTLRQIDGLQHRALSRDPRGLLTARLCPNLKHNPEWQALRERVCE